MLRTLFTMVLFMSITTIAFGATWTVGPGGPPAYDFAAPGTPVAGPSPGRTGTRVPAPEPSATAIREQPERCVV